MKFPIEMYRIYMSTTNIVVPCEKCFLKGYVSCTCNICGGRGVHYKSLPVWKLAYHPVTIDMIDREINVGTGEGDLRYWVGCEEFYEESSLLLHFTKEQAIKECNRRNKDVQNILDNASQIK